MTCAFHPHGLPHPTSAGAGRARRSARAGVRRWWFKRLLLYSGSARAERRALPLWVNLKSLRALLPQSRRPV